MTAPGLSRRAALAVAAAVSASVPLGACGPRPLATDAGGWLGASAERGHLLRGPAGAAAFAPGVRRRAAVVVVGAGIAGLAAARTLVAAGIDDIQVLDLEDAAGGNSRGHRLGGMACPLGAHYLPVPGPQAVEVAALLDELGLRRTVAGWPVYDERTLCHTPRERLHIGGSWHEGLLPPIEALPRAEQAATLAEYRRFAAAVSAVGRDGAFAMPTARARWTPALSALDAVTFDTWLDREGYASPALRWYLDYCCRDDYGAGSARVSAWAGLHYHASRHGFAAPGTDVETDSGDGLLTWPQGNAWLVERMAAPLATRIATGRVALRVREQRGGVEVDVLDVHLNRSERWTASQVVLAVPLFVAARLVESASPALAAAAGLVDHAPWLVGNLWLDRALDDHPGAPPSWDNVVYDAATRPPRAPGLPAVQTLGYVDAMHQSLRPDAGATVLTTYWALGGGSAADAATHRSALYALPRSAWAAAVVADLAGVHPDLPARLRAIDLARYGHAMAIPAPGVRSSAALQALASPSAQGRRVVHAHADLSGYSVFEEALYHGTRAGHTVAQRLAG